MSNNRSEPFDSSRLKGNFNVPLALLTALALHALLAVVLLDSSASSMVFVPQPQVTEAFIVKEAAAVPALPTSMPIAPKPIAKPAINPPVISTQTEASSVSVLTPPVEPSADSSAAAPTTPPASAAASEPSSPQPIVPAPMVPAPIQLRYVMNKGIATADAHLSWQHSPAQTGKAANYELSFTITAGFFTLLKQTSTGEVTDIGLVPVRHTDKRIRRSEQAVHFDAEQKRISFSNNRPSAPLLQGTQDRLSMLVQLAAIFQGKNAAQPSATWKVGDRIELPVSSTEEVEPWLWVVQDNQPDKEMQTGQTAQEGVEWRADWLKIQRQPRRAYDVQLELWLSPQLGYLPARIRQTDSSGVTDQVLTRTN